MVARVEEIRAIEGADKIRLVVVDGGDGPVEVVCGAFNFAVGDLVPLAPVGAVLPGGFAIGRRKLRGVTSNGMLCSGAELGLSDDHEGILVLGSGPSGPAVGTPLTECPRHRARRGLRHHRGGQPSRCVLHGGRGPRPGRPLGAAVQRRARPAGRRFGSSREQASRRQGRPSRSSPPCASRTPTCAPGSWPG